MDLSPVTQPLGLLFLKGVKALSAKWLSTRGQAAHPSSTGSVCVCVCVCVFGESLQLWATPGISWASHNVQDSSSSIELLHSKCQS